LVPIKDLLYGMMLPSGNDAAWSLAYYFGRLIFREQRIQYS
jgi:D-alanyl-D-alanine carboxypeptidase